MSKDEEFDLSKIFSEIKGKSRNERTSELAKLLTPEELCELEIVGSVEWYGRRTVGTDLFEELCRANDMEGLRKLLYVRSLHMSPDTVARLALAELQKIDS